MLPKLAFAACLAALLFLFTASTYGEQLLTVCEADDVQFPYLVSLDTVTGATDILGNLDPDTTDHIYPPFYCGRPAFGMHKHCDGFLYMYFSDTDEDGEFSYYDWGTMVRRFDVNYPNGQGVNFNAGHTDKYFPHGTFSGFAGDCAGNLLSLNSDDGMYYATNFANNNERSVDVSSTLSYGSLAYNSKTGVVVGMNVDNEYAWYPGNISTPAAYVYYLDPVRGTTAVAGRAITDSADFFRDYDNFELSNDGQTGYMLVDTALYVPSDGQAKKDEAKPTQTRGCSRGKRGYFADTPAVNTLLFWNLANVSIVNSLPLDGPFQACYGLTKNTNPCNTCAQFILRPPAVIGKREPTDTEPATTTTTTTTNTRSVSSEVPLVRS